MRGKQYVMGTAHNEMGTKSEIRLAGVPKKARIEKTPANRGLSNRCTFDINGLSGTFLIARGVTMYLFCFL